MSARDESTENHNSSILDILQPTDLDGEALTWDGNNAKILGLLDAIRRASFKRSSNIMQYFSPMGK